MRTTLTLERDVYEAALTLSRSSGRTMGQVVSSLARAGLKRRRLHRGAKDTLPRFPVSAGTPPISIEAVRRGWEEED
jgi:hypothetical protein